MDELKYELTMQCGSISWNKAGSAGIIRKKSSFFRHALLWHPGTTSTTPAVPTLCQPPQKQQPWESYIYNVSVKPGSKVCQAYDQGLCSDGSSHPKDLHICSYCLEAVRRLFTHQERHCRQKALDLMGKKPSLGKYSHLVSSLTLFIAGVDNLASSLDFSG